MLSYSIIVTYCHKSYDYLRQMYWTSRARPTASILIQASWYSWGDKMSAGVNMYWCKYLLVYRCTGVLVYWCTGLLVQLGIQAVSWCKYVMVYMCTCVLAYWCTCVLVYRLLGTAGYTKVGHLQPIYLCLSRLGCSLDKLQDVRPDKFCQA